MFSLKYATLARGEMHPPYRYDVALQLNTLPDGTIAARDVAMMGVSGPTTSTAGSKTSNDDTEAD
ncbi:hypothetical protein AB0G83_07450 [Streptomyces klenkii]|uniref:hypothetical protein n=1 Tax=Streptomyces klenkii TaxID=1420899 RepID=UPI0033BFC518